MTVATRNCYFLGRALESLRTQYWHNLELICACDHTELVDEVQEFMTLNKLRGKVFLTPSSNSRYLKFMQCVRECNGRWIVVLDCDDELEDGALFTVDQCLKMFPQYKYFTTAHSEIDIDSIEIAQRENDPQELTLLGLQGGFRQRHLWGFRRDDLPYLSPALQHHYCVEDYHFFAMNVVRGYFPLCIPFRLYRYRRHSVQITQVEQQAIADMIRSIRHSVARYVDSSHELILLKSAQWATQAATEQALMREKVDPVGIVF
jgi:glycosyltransferase involved in cell wall biosynthesis